MIMMIRNNVKLKFIKSFEREFWFVDNNYSGARKVIGKDRFLYIVNHNIPNCSDESFSGLRDKVKEHIKSNKDEIIRLINEKGNELEKKWRKTEDAFFRQMEEATGIKWKYKEYNVYLLFSCLWGGDYDIGAPNIYINPLLEYGDPLYVVFHELSHLMYWEFISESYPQSFIPKNKDFLWRLSEVMVNYPLLKLKLKTKIPLVIPENLAEESKGLVKRFSKESFKEIIKCEIEKGIK